MPTARERLIVALDVATAAEAQRLTSQIGDSAGIFKVGKQLFTAEGPQVVRDLVASGRQVFLDLKFHDISNTVAGAVASAAALGVSMLTVHASGGSKMLKAAVEAAAGGPKVIAVTVLTSLSNEDLGEIGVAGRVRDQVLRLASLALGSGCQGVVASPNEVSEIRRELGTGFDIVTPGVRPAGSAKGDQARVATPAEAIFAGATYLVVGRPITGADDPAAAAKAVLKEIEEASRNA
jgi:orotidine-5'-phosphate decarboxylase